MKRGIFIFLLLFILCVVSFCLAKQSDHPWLVNMEYKDFLSSLASIAGLFVALAFILEYYNIEKSDRVLRQLPFAEDSRDYWSSMERHFQADPDLYPLYCELHSNHPDLLRALHTRDYKKIKEVQSVSLLLAAIENLLILQGSDHSGSMQNKPRQEQQLQVWRRYFKSPTVRYHYQFLQDNLGLDTRTFIEKHLF